MGSSFVVFTPSGERRGGLDERAILSGIAEGSIPLDALVAPESAPERARPITQYPRFADAFAARMGIGRGAPLISQGTPPSDRSPGPAITPESLSSLASLSDSLTLPGLGPTTEDAGRDDTAPSRDALAEPDASTPLEEEERDEASTRPDASALLAELDEPPGGETLPSALMPELAEPGDVPTRVELGPSPHRAPSVAPARPRAPSFGRELVERAPRVDSTAGARAAPAFLDPAAMHAVAPSSASPSEPVERATRLVALAAGLAAWAVCFAVLFSLSVVAGLGPEEAALSPRSALLWTRVVLLSTAGLGLASAFEETRRFSMADLAPRPPWLLAAVGSGLAVGVFAGAPPPVVSLPLAVGLTVLHTVAAELFFRGFLARALEAVFEGALWPTLLGALLFGGYFATFAAAWTGLSPLAAALRLLMITIGAGVTFALAHSSARSYLPPLAGHLALQLGMLAAVL